MKISRKGLMLVLSSPSGAGKSTISRAILERDEHIYMSVSATTRKMRQGEVDGVDYYFISEREFLGQAVDHQFLEHAEVFGNMYGTPKGPVYEKLDDGKDILFDIDWQGTEQLKKRCSKDVVSVFILPPSMAELEKRLRGRGQDSEEVIQNRMSKAASEISHWDSYDYILINKDLEETIDKVHNILKAERANKRRLAGMQQFVDESLLGKVE